MPASPWRAPGRRCASSCTRKGPALPPDPRIASDLALDIILRATVLYFFILIILRVTTRRILRSATSLDLVVIFLLGGFAMPSILNGDQSLTGAILGMATVAGLHFALSRLRTRWPLIGQITEGTAVSIYARQGFDENQMLRSRLTMQDVVAEMRQSGLSDLGDVESIIVEHNGAITVMPKAGLPDVAVPEIEGTRAST